MCGRESVNTTTSSSAFGRLFIPKRRLFLRPTSLSSSSRPFLRASFLICLYVILPLCRRPVAVIPFASASRSGLDLPLHLMPTAPAAVLSRRRLLLLNWIFLSFLHLLCA
ncbi:hypothetical protein SESBI_35131 [Sesbania bispinosa]|nr:hypothetical protein SESBI_35131 [Sesbania bispinosa]